MRKFLDLHYWQAVLRNPAAVTGLFVDLAPIVGVFVWGWGAAALVLLYWLENLVIGVATAGRIFMSSIGKDGLKGLFGGAWLVAFFTVHYGIFCLAHGGLLLEFLNGGDGWSHADTVPQLVAQLVASALAFGRHMGWIFTLIILWHALALLDFIRRGDWKGANPNEEMFAPYGRIILLHFGVFIVGGALTALGSPTVGLLVLVLARAVWGLHVNMQPRRTAAPTPAPAAS